MNGDLDKSYLREMPPGRGEVKTYVREAEAEEKIWAHLQDRIQVGDRAYVVVPRLGEEVQDPADEASVKRTYDFLVTRFGSRRVALLHGKMKEQEKLRILDGFRKGEISILAATTVVEVGVDVPEANFMVIDHADRLGLSQLHQLRGRIGRGGKSGKCILIQRAGGQEARERLVFLEKHRDGFLVAEEDFRIRGPGDTLGEEQSGVPRYRHARLPWDSPIFTTADLEAVRLWQGGWHEWRGLVEAEKLARADFAAN
ncbi:MAG TPA: hypothetical protein DEO44_01425 [Verrucomicrobia subdivision 6 bacterium]|nr:hypothetical protein [Verrucomicrobia subdivision 6 bacterium]HCP06378.1 hypothetical protein [Verrucomicrobiales bacterium]